jgi:pimeloyl-ACP methyl ester carboxylesterase
MHRVAVAGTHVEVEELGAGAPAVVVQTALSVDEHAPLSRELSASLHVWHVHRPGYGGSGPARVPGSVEADADLVAAVVDRFEAAPVHLVGASYSAAVALSLATRHPDAVRSLALVEPPPYDTAGAEDFRAVTTALAETVTRSGTAAALEELMQIIGGPAWRADAERDLPGSVAAMERDAGTFFESDLPALLGWTFDDEQAAGIRCPTLLVGGATSHPWFAEMLDRLQRVVPSTTRASVPGAGHSVALTHPVEVGAAVLAHVRDVSPGRPAAGKGADHS